MRTKIIIILAAIFSMAINVKAQNASGWVYQNEKYNYQITLPDIFGGMGESPSGDGQIFASADSEAHISVYGGFNANTLLSKDVSTEYNETIERLSKSDYRIEDHLLDENPGGDIDAQYFISGKQHRLCSHQRTIWYGDYSATVIFTYYPSDKATYEPLLKQVINSLSPNISVTESMELYDLWNDGLTLSIPSQIKNPNIIDLTNTFVKTFQKPLTNIVKEKIDNPDYQNEDIEEWMYDLKNGFLTCSLINDSEYWMETCYWKMDNGHKLFAVSYIAPTQALIFFDYDPKTHRCTPATQQIEPLKDCINQYYGRLPRIGKTITFYNHDNRSKPVMKYTWNGTKFIKE